MEKHNIKAVVITLMNNGRAVESTRNLLKSIRDTKSQINPFVMDATTPETIDVDLKEIHYLKGTKVQYTWPTNESENGLDLKTGLYRKAYQANDVRKVIACMVSHMRAWQTCIELDEPLMVLEQDAYFTRRFTYRYLLEPKPLSLEKDWFDRWLKTKELSVLPWSDEQKFTYLQQCLNKKPEKEFSGGILGLNCPIGATRKAVIFHKALFGNHGIHGVPSVDGAGDDPLPQGIAGNSAYIIKPWAAKKLLDKVREIGMWPNDALMCKQFFPWMHTCWPYYTVVQGTKSTTTG